MKSNNPERRYHVVLRDDQRGRDTYMTARPEAHRAATTILSKQSPARKHFRYLLVESTPTTDRYAVAGEGPAPKRAGRGHGPAGARANPAWPGGFRAGGSHASGYEGLTEAELVARLARAIKAGKSPQAPSGMAVYLVEQFGGGARRGGKYRISSSGSRFGWEYADTANEAARLFVKEVGRIGAGDALAYVETGRYRPASFGDTPDDVTWRLSREHPRYNPAGRRKAPKANPRPKVGLPTLAWDEPKGAATPRGWVRMSRHVHARDAHDSWAAEASTVGNYVTYESQGAKPVLATAYVTLVDPNTRARHEVRLGSDWFATPAEAKRWIARRVWAALRNVVSMPKAGASAKRAKAAPRARRTNPAARWMVLIPNQHGEERMFGPYPSERAAKDRLRELESKGQIPDGRGGFHVFRYGTGRLKALT